MRIRPVRGYGGGPPPLGRVAKFIDDLLDPAATAIENLFSAIFRLIGWLLKIAFKVAKWVIGSAAVIFVGLLALALLFAASKWAYGLFFQ